MARDPIWPSRLAAALCGSMGLMMCLGLAAAASPSAASSDAEDDCPMRLRRMCCNSRDIILLMGCAPTQRIPLDLGPGHFEVFVDGERVPGNPGELALRTDESHVVFVKRAGHIPQLVVLESEPEPEKPEPRLSPAHIALRLLPRRVQGGDVRVVMDREAEQNDDLSAAGFE